MLTETLYPQKTPLNLGFVSWNSPQGRQVMELRDGLTLGRDFHNDLVLSDPCASHRHARIELRQLRFIIRDLRSKNGVHLNGTPILEAELKDGDLLTLGQTELTVSVSDHLMAPQKQNLTSRNPQWQSQLERLPSFAKSDLPVLLTGPSGSGKEVIASALHEASSRHNHPMICVNCSALHESLIESELFGHVKGSFTGATHDRQGAFEAARGGTLFLDEIGDLPLHLQPKLLRALENSQFRPVGSDRTIQSQVRIIAATHHHLDQRVQDNSFRRDLYFRLNVIRIQLPALVQRLEDFEDLLYFFGKSYRVGLSFAAIQKLKEHDWPGNIRELRNFMARAKAYFPGEKIDVHHLQHILEKQSHLPKPSAPGSTSKTSSRLLLKELEHEMIQSRLIANQGNQRQTAHDLGIPKSTLHDRIKTYGIDIKELLEQS